MNICTLEQCGLPFELASVSLVDCGETDMSLPFFALEIWNKDESVGAEERQFGLTAYG